MTTPYFIELDLRQTPVLIVGGGKIAARKALALLDAGATLTIISPTITDDLRDRIADSKPDRIRWKARNWRFSDIGERAALIFAATDDAELNAKIVAIGRRAGKLVNAVSADSGRMFSTPATAHGAGISIAVSSAGANVHLAKQWRDHFATQLPTNSADTAPIGSAGGSVTLVGAGPGDPDLLTVGGKRAIERADVLVFDNLVSPDVLALAPPHAERIAAGKDPFGERVSQAEINATLIAHAKAGKRVVRLKGGDPFLFGRGAEEVEAVAAAGLRFRVIPGVSALNGVLGAAGIAITKRDRNHGFAVFSAAERTPASEVAKWARTPGPLAIFMGVRNATFIADALIDSGRRMNEPVIVIARGGTTAQRIAETTLAGLPALLARPHEWNPALIVVGVKRETAFANRPLDGQVAALNGISLTAPMADEWRTDGAFVANLVAEKPAHPFAVAAMESDADFIAGIKADVNIKLQAGPESESAAASAPIAALPH